MIRSWFSKLLLGFFFLFLLALPRAFPLLAVDFPKPVGFVNDLAGVFSSSFHQELEADLQKFEQETGVEIAVVAIDSLEGDSIENKAVQLFEQWGIGKKEKDNGLLILIAKDDRKMRIEVGYGLEPIITDGRAGRIIREQMQSAFREENYDQGVRQAIEEIKKYIRSGESPAYEEEIRKRAESFFPLLIFGAFFLIYFSSFLARSKRYWPGGIVGGFLGGIFGLFAGALGSFLFLVLILGLLGFILDYILSKNYKKRIRLGKPTDFFSSWGGFSSGGSGGGGGFGGGSSGGGGTSGSW